MLRCIRGMDAHWGSILTEGKIYDSINGEKEVVVIIDNDGFYKALKNVKKDDPNAGEKYKYISDFTKIITVPTLKLKTDDNNNKIFINLTKKELINLGADGGNGGGFCRYTEYLVEDYFIDIKEDRNNKLNEIGIS